MNNQVCLFNGRETFFSNGFFHKHKDSYAIRCLSNENDEISIVEDIQEAGRYSIKIEYLCENVSLHHLYVNGNFQGNMHFAAAKDSATLVTLPVYLKKGLNRLTLGKGWGEFNFLGMAVVPESQDRAFNPDFKLSNQNASPECIKIMDFFKSIHGKYILTGQHASGYPVEIDYIEQITGKLPAVVGFDLMSYSSALNTPGSSRECLHEIGANCGSVEKALYWAKEKGALVSFCWHWFSPAGGRDKSFYTEHTDFNLEKALNEKGVEYEGLLYDIDMISEQLKIFRDEGIPILWRPLHEAEGKWFWWGASGPEPYIQLYRIMYDRMTRVHELNNLIWVWNAPGEGWYPGDDVTDINSMDIYAPAGNPGGMALEFEKGLACAGRDLPIALGEVGTAPDPDLLESEGLSWLWFMLWCGFTQDPEKNSVELLKKVFNSHYTLALDEYVRMMEKL